MTKFDIISHIHIIYVSFIQDMCRACKMHI